MYAGSLDGRVWVGEWASREEAIRKFPVLSDVPHGRRFQTAKATPSYTSEGILYETEYGQIQQHGRSDMVILISGQQGSGKTSTADAVAAELTARGYVTSRTRFAKPLYDMHDAVLKVLADYGMDRGIKKDGPLLQLIGTEWGRKTINENIWVKLTQKWFSGQGTTQDLFSKRVFILDDLRFKNEFTAFDGLSPVLRVRLQADREVRKARCDQWRDNETHQSEVDLDDWLDKFDLVFSTDKPEWPLGRVVDLIVGEIDAKFSKHAGAAAGEKLHTGGDQKSLEAEM